MLGVVCCLAFASGARAAEARPVPLASEIPVEPHFETVGAGAIPRDVVATLAQDTAGFVWIATGDGLVRHDGYRFRPQEREAASPADRNLGWIRSLLAARDGRLWIATESQGLAVHDPASGRVSLIAALQAADAAAGLSSVPQIHALAEGPDGSIWIGRMGGGLTRYEPAQQRVTHHRQTALDGSLPDDRVLALLVGRDGTLWVGTWQGLSRLVPGSGRFETVFGGPEAGREGLVVQALFQAADDRIWLGTRRGELALVDPATGQGQLLAAAQSDPQAGPPRGAVTAFLQPPGGPVWVGHDGGIDLFDAQQGRWLQSLRHDLCKPAGLAGHQVTSLMLDRAGWIWVGGVGIGLQRHNPGNRGIRVHTIGPAPGSCALEADVRSLLALDTGDIWFGAQGGGVAVMDAQLRVVGSVPLASDASPAPGAVTAMRQLRDGSVWLGANGVLMRLDRQRQPRGRMRHEGGIANQLHESGDGTLWAATQDGLYRLAPGAATLQRMRLAGGPALAGDVYVLAETPELGLIAGTAKGLFRIPPGATELEPVQAEPGHGLGNPIVIGLLVDRRGGLWLDTPVAGLHRLVAWDGTRARFDRVSARHGHVNRPFGSSLLEDGRGRIWTHMHVYDPAADRLDTLNASDGVRIGNGRFLVHARTADGRLLFGGTKGLLVVRPEAFDRPTHAPPLVVSEVRVDGEPYSAGPGAPGLQLQPGQRGFSVEFAALDFTEAARVRYAYRLDKYDEDWVETGAELRVAAYSNLWPGRYLLRVRATTRSGVPSPAELALPVQVHPAWWQTWYALGLLVIGLLVAGRGVVALRLRVLQRRHDKLERVVGERTARLQSTKMALEQKTLALEATALIDPLTGLHNRRFLLQRIESDTTLAVRRHENFRRQGMAPPDAADLVFFMVDIDHFKRVNDDHGHDAGDAVLVQMRGRLQQVFREADYLVRWGGEEFLIVARDAARAGAAELAERVRRAVSDQPFVLADGLALRKTCSIGFACFPLAPELPRALDWAATVKLADAALYEVKRSGRDGWLGLISARADTEADLRRGLQRPLPEWRASGALQLVESRPMAPLRPPPAAGPQAGASAR